MQGPITAQEQADLAVAEMKARRQDLEASGLQPGTVRFERNVHVEPFRTSEYTQMRGTGASRDCSTCRPYSPNGGICNASEPLIERSLAMLDQAQITSTAAGTAIRGKSPSYQNAPAKEERRQLFGTSDASVHRCS